MTRLLDDHAAKITECLNKKVKEQERKINQLEGLLNAAMSKITILLNNVLHQDQGENIKGILALDAPSAPTKTTVGFPSYYCTHQEIQEAVRDTGV